MKMYITKCMSGLEKRTSRKSRFSQDLSRAKLKVELLESRQLLCEPCANAQITDVESGDPDDRVPMSMPVYLHAVVTVDGVPSEECKLSAEYQWRFHKTPLGGAQGPLSEWSGWAVGAYWWSASFVGPNEADVEARWLLNDGSYHTFSASGSVEIMPPVMDVFRGFEPATVPVPLAATIDAVFEGGYTATDELLTGGIKVYERHCDVLIWDPSINRYRRGRFQPGDTRCIDADPGWQTTSWRDPKGFNSPEPGTEFGTVYYRHKQTNFVKGTTSDGTTHDFLMTQRTFDRILVDNNRWIVTVGPTDYDW